MDRCLGLKHPQHFLQMCLQKDQPFKISMSCFKKKKQCLFGVASQWNTKIQSHVSCNLELRVATVSFLCYVGKSSSLQRIESTGFIVQGKDWIDFQKRHGCVVGLLIIHEYKFALTDHQKLPPQLKKQYDVCICCSI